jgi:hypothetical protein
MREGDTVKIGDEEFEVLSVYTRAQAIEDGVLIDVTNLAPDLVQNAGIKLHVAMTREVWDEYVEVPAGLVGQDWKGRLYDILFMFTTQARRARKASEILFQLCVQNDPRRKAQRVTLKAVCGPDDAGKPCVTILTPSQD